MGKKYIIELEDKPFHKGNGDFLYRVKGFNSLVFDMTGVGKLTPYTEPDLEQVRKEAYAEGSKEDYDEAYLNGYNQGLEDAWEAARKISSMDSLTRDEVFGLVITSNIFDENTASEAIEKIRQYEQGKEEQIQVGDEVISPNGKGVVTEIKDIYVRIMYAKGSGQVVKPEDLTKTGRHFPEIAEVLEKMREE